MPIDFTRQLVNFDDEPMTDVIVRDNQPTQVPLTLERVAAHALLGALANEPPVDAQEHLNRFILAQKIKGNRQASLSAEDVAMLKVRIAKGYNNAMIVGQAIAMLDPDAVAAAIPKAA